MLTKAIYFLITTSLNLLTMLFLLRFFMQLVRAPFNNSFSYMVVTLTNFVVKPMRRIIPSFGKFDLSTLFLATLTQIFLHCCLLWLGIITVENSLIWLYLLKSSFLGVFLTGLDVFFYALLLQVVLSWVNPQSPISGLLNSLTKPILAPIQRVLPVSGGIDFSPVAALFLMQMIKFSLS